MNTKLLIIFCLPIFLLMSGYSLSQESLNLSTIESKLDSLSAIKTNLETSLEAINKEIEILESKRINILVANDTTKGILVKVSGDGFLKEEPTTITNIIMKLPKGTEVVVIGYTESYFKAKVGEKVGYVHEMFFAANDDLSRISKYSAKLGNSPTTNSSSSKTYTSSGSSSTSSGGRTIYTGPRGGKYYINSKGNKVYIKKK